MEDNIRSTYVELTKGNVRPIYTEVNTERKLDVAIRGVCGKKDCTTAKGRGFNG